MFSHKKDVFKFFNKMKDSTIYLLAIYLVKHISNVLSTYCCIYRNIEILQQYCCMHYIFLHVINILYYFQHIVHKSCLCYEHVLHNKVICASCNHSSVVLRTRSIQSFKSAYFTDKHAHLFLDKKLLFTLMFRLNFQTAHT